MASLLYRLGLGSFRHRRLVVIIWLAVLAAVGAGSLTLAGTMSDSVSIPGLESTDAQTVLAAEFGPTPDTAAAQVVVEVPSGQKVTDPATVTKLNALVSELGSLPGVATASDPLDSSAPTVSADLRAAYSTVTYAATAANLTSTEKTALSDAVTAASSPEFTVAVQGSATDSGGAGLTELIGIVVALVILAITYGSLLMAGVNLVASLIGVGIGSLGISTLSGFVTLSDTTSSLALMLGLAVGIDYALFIMTRFRHELRKGRDLGDAIATTVGTAGSAVVTAGATVVIALAGLAVVGIPFLAEMGFAAAATVVIAVLIAVTLVPAILGFIGFRALPKRIRAGVMAMTPEAVDVDDLQVSFPGFFGRLAGLVTRRRWLVLVSGVLALGIIAIPFASMRTTLLPSPSEGTTQAQAQAIMDDHFGPGASGPLIILVDGAGAAERANTISEQAAAMADVSHVGQPVLSGDQNAAIVTVIPKSGPTSVETEQLVRDIRTTFQTGAGPQVSVTGSTAVSVDVSEKLAQALPIYILLIVGLALILLVLVFRSILVPVTAVLGFLLTIAASFGAATAVFEWGWAKDLFGTTIAPINSVAPIIIVGVLFGLAMDYQVFLVSRIHEAHSKGASPRNAVAHGFHKAAPVVVAAAAIMFSVFGGFFPGGDSTLKPIAFTLATGVLIDAFVVRMLLMPAVITIMGRYAWSLPTWLRWLPELDVEGLRLEQNTDAAVRPEGHRFGPESVKQDD
ncbi:MMPL family transporter [Subtercola frigoramans]|uniref:RND superfamily putative drug exporter n=1 Tax=Subtercola frigoramans TaxID=120298 RepID=A0ABS2L0Z6_9MICO|nr:MMPL family transporter [Subtercola frigoramans]MBM7470744.1 RND superfamily putative drug exporter [Subtercola frigoramans]